MPEQITILSENRCALSRGLIAEHGFSALIELDGFKLLFDSGQGMALRQNQILGYDLSKIDGLVLSHGHYDHTGGMGYALEKNPRLKIYLHPAALLKRKARKQIAGREIEVEIGMPMARAEMESRGAELNFIERRLELAEGRILVSGPIPLRVDFEKPEAGFFVEREGRLVPDDFADDLALAIKGKNGVSVIFGCAHRGAINTLKRIEELWGVSKFDLVMGGMHLLMSGPEQVNQTLDALASYNPSRLAVGHCTGDFVQLQIAQRFPGRFSFPSSGMKIALD